MKPLETMVAPFGLAWWKALGETVVRATKDLAERGVGGAGKWPGYSADYAKAKGADKFRRQSSQQIAPPNLELTGDLWNDFKVFQARETGASVGTIAHGAKAWGQESQGRPIFTDDGPAAPVRRQIDTAVRAKLAAQINGTRGSVRVRVGK